MCMVQTLIGVCPLVRFELYIEKTLLTNLKSQGRDLAGTE